MSRNFFLIENECNLQTNPPTVSLSHESWLSQATLGYSRLPVPFPAWVYLQTKPRNLATVLQVSIDTCCTAL